MLLLLLRNADPGPGRPDLTSRITRLSAAGVPERYRAFTPKGAAPVDAEFSGSLSKLASTLAGTTAPPDFNAALSGALAPLTGSVDAFLNRPDVRYTALTAAGVPGRWRAFTPKGQSTEAALSGALPALASSLAGTHTVPTFSGPLEGSLGALASTLAGTTAPPDFDAALSGALASLTGSVDAFLNRPAGRYTTLTVAGVPGRWRAFTSKAQSFDATLSGALPALASSLAGTTAPPNFDAALSAALPKLASSLAGTTAVPQFDAALSGVLAPITGAIAGDSGGTTATLAGGLPKLAGALAAQHTVPQFDLQLAGALPTLSGAIAGTATPPQFSVALSGTLGPLSGSIDGMTGAYAFVLSGALPGLRGRLYEREPTAIALRFRDVPTVTGFALEVRLLARVPSIQIAGRVRELTLLGRIVDEDSQRTA